MPFVTVQDLTLRCVSHEKGMKAKVSRGKRREGYEEYKKEADTVSLLSDELDLLNCEEDNGTPSVSQILSYVLRRCRRATGSGACEASGSYCWTGS